MIDTLLTRIGLPWILIMLRILIACTQQAKETFTLQLRRERSFKRRDLHSQHLPRYGTQ